MALGEQLRKAREARGLTLSQVAEATRMMVQIVEGIEREDFQRVAAPIYGRGFIRLYAEQVGLDPAPLVDEYMRRFVSDRKALGAASASGTEPVPTRNADGVRAPVATPDPGTSAATPLPGPADPPSPAVSSEPQTEPRREPDLFSPPAAYRAPPAGAADPASASPSATGMISWVRTVESARSGFARYLRRASRWLQDASAAVRPFWRTLSHLPRQRDLRGIFWISTVGVVVFLVIAMLVVRILSRAETDVPGPPEALFEWKIPPPLPYVD